MRTLRFLSALVLSTFSSLGAVAGCASSVAGPGEGRVGTAAGAACAFDDQCATGRCSADPVLGTCGECVEIQPLGASCTGPHQGCSASAVCEDGVCRSTKKVAGEACGLEPKGGDEHECDDELYCAPVGDTWETGVCTARVPVGGACDGWESCVRGASCNAAHVCAIPVPGSCAAGSSGCEANTFCGADLQCHPGTLEEGAPCGIVDGSFVDDECKPGLVCGSLEFPDGGGGPGTVTTCLPLPEAGAPCLTGACGEGLFCHRKPEDSGVALPLCEPLRGEGEACSSPFYYDIRCAAGLECRKDTCQIACH